MGPDPNDPIVTVTTPDGRTVQLPQSVARNFTGSLSPMQQAPAPTIASTDGAQGIAPPISQPLSARGLSAPGIAAPAKKPNDGIPTFSDAESDRLDPTNPANNPPKQVTQDQLRKGGEAEVFNQHAQAVQDGLVAGRNLANIEATRDLAIAAAKHDQSVKIDTLLQKRADDVADQQKQMQSRVNDYDLAVKQYADFKVDRSIAHPVLAALGVLMGAVGAAWANKSENPAMTALQQAMKDNVAAQLADRDALGNVINQRKSAIDIIRQQASDKNAQWALAMAAESERTIRMGDEIMARSASPIVKAEWQVKRADLKEKQAEYYGTAVDKQHAADQQAAAQAEQIRHNKNEEGIGYQGLKDARDEKKYQHEKDEKDRQFAYDNLAERGMKDELAALKGKASTVAQNGIADPNTGKVLLQPEGEKMVKDAEGFDSVAKNFRAAASTAADPAKRQTLLANADAYEKKAAITRVQAEADHAFTIENKEAGEKVREVVIGGQKMTDLISRVRAGVRDGSLFDRNKMAEISALYGEAKATFGHAMGARFNEKEFETLDQILGGDPSDWKNLADVKLGRTEAKLDAVLKTTISGVQKELAGHQYRGTWKPERTDGEAAPLSTSEQSQSAVLEGKTPTEQAEGAKRGAIGTALTSDASPLKKPLGWLGVDDEETGRDRAQNQKQSNNGLLPEQQQHVDMLIRGAKPGPDGAEAKKALLALATSDRPSISNAVLNELRDRNPALYKQAIDKLPADQRQAREAASALPSSDPRDQARTAVMQAQPIAELRQAAILGDDASKREIYRRAVAGDQNARAAAAEVVRSIGAK